MEIILPNISAIQKQLDEAIDTMMLEMANDTKKEFQKITRSWKHRVQFIVRKTATGYLVSTDHPVFHYVNSGTRAHWIRPRSRSVLRFKTTSSRGYVFSKKVRHPGTKARRYSDAIAATMDARFDLYWRSAQRSLL